MVDHEVLPDLVRIAVQRILVARYASATLANLAENLNVMRILLRLKAEAICKNRCGASAMMLIYSVKLPGF